MTEVPVRPADRLGREKYISLTTYRRTGEPVTTPVWVIGDGERLLVWTAASAGKAKRIRHTSRVTVAACNARGNVHGPVVEGTARIVPEEVGELWHRIRGKYRVAARALKVFNQVVRLIRRRPPGRQVAIEITFG